MNMERHFTRRN